MFSLNAIGTVFAVNGVATFSQIYLPLLIMNVAGLYVASAVVQHRLGILSTFRTALAQSRLDALTGLANRRQFDEDLAELQPGETLLMLDIDHFKAINDFHGHAAGDAVLREMGRFLGSALRGSDSAYRFGGEEFAVILRGDLPPSVTQISERLRRQVAALPPAAPSLRPGPSQQWNAWLCPPYDVGTTSMRSPRATSIAGISDAGSPMRYARMQRMTEACPMMSRSSFSRSSSIRVGSSRTGTRHQSVSLVPLRWG